MLDRVSYRYPGRSVAAISDVSCSIPAGSTIGVLGANGSGKSTLALLLAGLLEPSSGSVNLNGPGESDESPLSGLLLQNPDNNIVGATVAEDIAFGPFNMGLSPDDVAELVAEVTRSVGVTSLVGRDPAALSEGEKQLVALAGLLAMRPRFLILDEPTSALDLEGRVCVTRAVRRLARSHNIGIVLVSQDFEEILDADLVLILRQGRLEFTGTVLQALADEQRLSNLGVEPPALSFIWRQLQTLGYKLPSADVYRHEGAVEELCRLLS